MQACGAIPRQLPPWLATITLARAVRIVDAGHRHPPEPDQATINLSGMGVEIAQARQRFGYRRVHDMLRPEFPGVNHKRVYRLYSAANLAVRKRPTGMRFM